MELRHLRYFVAVAEEANFTRAAARLGIGQPPLSQQIKQLEALTGVRLFHRGAQGVSLTEAGQAFAPEARAALSAASRALQAARRAAQGEIGRLSVGFTSSASFNPVLPQAIRRFRRAFPEVVLSLVEANTQHLLDDLQEGRLDAVFIRPSDQAIDGLMLHRFADESMKIIVPSDHHLACGKPLPLTVLAGEPFVFFPRANGISLFEEVYKACIGAGFTPLLAQEAPQISSVVNLVAAGLGVSIVPAAIATVRVDGVQYLDIVGPAPKARLALAVRHPGDAEDGNVMPLTRASCVNAGEALSPLLRNFLALLPPPHNAGLPPIG
ncbi:LysR family transcriptional regulator [Robbsia andropogonis]|uniref:LysR family transcriptional regulator n=1 Tax=Robbsia andropogonis TaxID=28092 RepID=UPI000465A8CE|nr:LysR family transcriptional regulator [Robbsia andropogonis]